MPYRSDGDTFVGFFISVLFFFSHKESLFHGPHSLCVASFLPGVLFNVYATKKTRFDTGADLGGGP